MKSRKLLTYAAVILVLAVLVYLQVRTWRKFDWGEFRVASAEVFTTTRGLLHLIGALLAVYAAYILRAVRWSIFLRPVKPVPSSRLVAPQILGFTGLAVLGRPGELIRPYLIHKREDLSFASQLAVWSVERICDMGAFAILLIWNVLLAPPSLRMSPFFPALRKGSIVLLAGIVVLIIGAILVRKNSHMMADLCRKLFGFAPHFAEKLAHKVEAFSVGLNTVGTLGAAVEIAGVSLLIWFFIALSYLGVLHAYPAPLRDQTLGQVMLVMGSSMVGSMLQLPAVGGGSQLATISMMKNVLGIPESLAASAGITLWLATFMAVIPVGLIVARFEGISLFKVSEESKQEEEQETAEAR